MEKSKDVIISIVHKAKEIGKNNHVSKKGPRIE
jgi:hypothetical protein